MDQSIFCLYVKFVDEGLCCRPALRISFYRSDILPFIMSSEQRFAFEFDVLLRAASRKIRIDSVQISTIYGDRQQSHVEPFRDAWLLGGVIRNHLNRSKLP